MIPAFCIPDFQVPLSTLHNSIPNGKSLELLHNVLIQIKFKLLRLCKENKTGGHSDMAALSFTYI